MAHHEGFTERLRAGTDFRIADVDPASTPGAHAGKKQGARDLALGVPRLAELQEKLYAGGLTGEDPRRVLLVLQAMDTAGKGGIIRHVVGEVDPQGVHIHAFKAPTDEEKSHDFLWRVHRQLPAPERVSPTSTPVPPRASPAVRTPGRTSTPARSTT